jgi:hypothetical protein
MYDIEVKFNGMRSILNFIKMYQLTQNTDRMVISLSYSVFKENKHQKQTEGTSLSPCSRYFGSRHENQNTLHVVCATRQMPVTVRLHHYTSESAFS